MIKIKINQIILQLYIIQIKEFCILNCLHLLSLIIILINILFKQNNEKNWKRVYDLFIIINNLFTT
jgi:hypothetical protein